MALAFALGFARYGEIVVTQVLRGRNADARRARQQIVDLLSDCLPDEPDGRRIEVAVEDLYRTLKLEAPESRRRRFFRSGAPAVVVVGFYVVATLVARRRGYNMGGNVAVRCRSGHLFTTIWIPGASLKAVRLGWARFQRCPVGGHWTIVTPVKDSDLTDEERQTAQENKDIRIP